jgi:hypothetical protein
VQVEVFPLHGRLSNAVDSDQAKVVLLNQHGEDAIDMACTGTPLRKYLGPARVINKNY